MATTPAIAEIYNFTYPYTITYFPGTQDESVQNLTADGRVYLPEGIPVSEIRGVIVLSNGSGGDERRTLNQEWLQNFARVQKFAAIASGYDMRPLNSGSTASESLANFSNFLAGASTASGAANITSAPLVWMGMSYGGIESAHGARMLASKTLGFASQKGFNWLNGSNMGLPANNLNLSSAEQNVIGTFIPGERDTNNSVNPWKIVNGETLNNPGNSLYAGQGYLGWRTGGGRVSLAFDASTGHNDIANQGYDFSLTLMSEAIRLRHPGTLGQPLLNVPFNSGYLAERVDFGQPPGLGQVAPTTIRPTFPNVSSVTSYSGVNSATSASWLPSETAAQAYQAFTSTYAAYTNRTETPRQNPIQIETPSRFQNFTVGDSTLITVDTREWTPATKVEFFMNGVKLGEKTDGNWSWPVSNLAQGAHTVVALATNAASEKLAAFSTFTVQSVPAPTLTWTGGAGSNNATLNTNWTGGSAPLDAPALIAFDGAAANNQYTVGHSGFTADPRVWGMVFKNAPGSNGFTLNGWRRWEVGFGGITNLDDSQQTFTSLFRLRGSQTWNAQNGPMVFNPFDASNASLRNINLDGGYYSDTSKNAWYSTLTLQGNYDITINNPVVGVGYLVKEGPNTLVLAGDNTYTPPRTGAPPFPSGSNNDYYFINYQEDLRVHNGTVRLASTGFLPSTSRVFLANRAGVTLDIAGLNRTFAALSGGGEEGGTVLVNNGALILAGAPKTMSDHVPQTFRGTITLGTTGTLTLNGWDTNVRQALNGNVTGGTSGSVSIAKNNSHYVTLGGNAEFLGQVVVNEGRLQVESNNALGATGTGNETRIVGINGGTSGRLSFTKDGVNTPEDIILAYNHTSASYTSTSLLTLDTSGITATHSGNLVLDRTNTGTGTTDFFVTTSSGVTNSTLNITNATGANSGGFASGTTRLRLNAADASSSINQNGVISTGAATTFSFMLGGPGTKRISGLNTYNGSTQISAGTILFANDAADNAAGPFGQNANTVNFFDGGDASGSSASLLADGARTFGKIISLNSPTGGIGTATVGGFTAHTSTFSNQIRWGAGNTVLLRLTAATNGRVNITGEVRDNGNTNASNVTKIGPGIVALNRSAGNSYDGATTVSEGTLLVNNTSGSGTGTGAVTVASGAKLGGTGIISGSTTLQTGAGLSFDIAGSASSHDKLDISSTLALGSGASLAVSLLPGAAPTTGSYTLATAGSLTGSLGTVTLPSGWTGSAAKSGNNIVLTVTGLPAAPAAPATAGGSDITTTGLTLTWSSVSGVTGYLIERSTVSGSGYTTLATVASGTTSYTDTALAPGTTYYYRVTAYNNGGPSGFTQSSVTTLPNPPSAPTDLIATAVDASQITLTWVDTANNESGFQIERSTVSGSGFSLLTTTAPDATSFNDTGLTASTTYYYRVRATNLGGPSLYSNEANATTQFGTASWNVDASGNWSLASNWTTPSAPSAVDGAITLGNGPGTATPLRTITLDTDVTLGSLTASATLGLTNAGYILSTSTGKTLTFDVSTGQANLANPSGASSLRINTPITLADTLLLNAASTGDTGGAGTTASVFFSGAVNGPGGLVKNGAGNLRLASSIGQSFAGGVTLNQGQLILGTPASGVNINALGTGTFTVSNGASHQIDHNNFKYSAATPMTLANPATFTNPLHLEVMHATNPFLNWSLSAFNQGVLSLSGSWTSSAAISSDIVFNAGGATGFLHAGDRSALTFASNGKFWLKTGQHFIAHPDAFGSNNGAPIRLGRDAGGDSVTNEASLFLLGNYVIDSALTFNSTGTNSANRNRLGTVHSNIAGEFNGPITFTKESATRTVELWVGNNSTLSFDGILSDAGGSTFPNALVKFGAGTAWFTAANNYDGATTVADGLLLIEGNQTAANGTITLNGPVAGTTKNYVSGGANGTTSVVLADTTGLVIGMAVSGTNIQPHTFIRSISGTTVNLTTPTIGQLSGTLSFGGLNGGTLGGTGTHGGALNVAAGANLTFHLSTVPGNHDLFDLSGALSFSGSSSLTITADENATTGTYTLITAASITGTLPTLNLPTNWQATLQQSGGDLNLVITSTGSSPLETWREQNFGTTENTGTAADNHDYDNDGLPNLVEFALGTDPVEQSGNGVIVTDVSESHLTLTFTPEQTTGLSYVIEASNDLVTWTEQTELTPAAGQSYTHNDTANLGSNPRRFLRLRVLAP